jgi:hypothetical protein
LRLRECRCAIRGSSSAKSFSNPNCSIREAASGQRKSRYTGRTIFAALCFLLLFTILLTAVSHYYVMPGLELAKNLDRPARRKLAANAMLVLMLMLTLLVVGLLITFRISRFFFPRPTAPRARTKVVDAWAEAGKRLEKQSEQSDED